jgi:hypothetical protein
VAKRLLTDPAPALRSSLRDLLFKDGSFRWNRLENLLRNARDNRDYDLNHALNQGVDYLFSERGEFIRERITEELIKTLDSIGRGTVEQLTQPFREWIRLPGTSTRTAISGSSKPTSQPEQNSLEHLKRIFSILQDTPGFEPMQLLPIFMQLLTRPETQRMGQQIASGLVQRNLARLIREVLMADSAPASLNHYPQQQLSSGRS